VARGFLGYLQVAFPQLRRPSQLRRDPHLLGWFRWLCAHQPPLSNPTRTVYLHCLRRLLDDLAANGHPLPPDLIRRDDFPPQAHYLPRPLPPEDDQRLQQELRRTDDLPANALLLTRATGIRIGECIDLPLDGLRQLGSDQWALHVPLGKLHTERLVPADAEVRRLVARIQALRALAPPAHLAQSKGFLLPRALMQLLGHKDIRMTLRYVEVTQLDLQREFHTARQRAASPHRVPVLSVPHSATTDLPGIRQALAATRHLLEMYRRGLPDEKTRRRLQRLDRRLPDMTVQLDRITTAEK